MTTEYQQRISRKYLLYQVLTNFWFVTAIWLYFYRIFITDQQIGILDSLAFAIGLIAEVPSGVLADKFGRDRLVKLGQILSGLGFFIQAFGSGYVAFFIGQSIMMIGVSFVSGADQALFFGKLNFEQDSLQWRKLVTRGSQVALIVTLLATVTGAYLYQINPRIPWILSGIFCMSSSILIWNFRETRIARNKQSFMEEFKEYISSMVEGFVYFFKPKLFLYIGLIVVVQGLFYTIDWGLLRLILLDRFHFDPFIGSVIIAVSSLFTVGILSLMHKYAEKMDEANVITYISVGVVISLLVSVFDVGIWGCVVIFYLYAAGHILHPFMSDIFNSKSNESHRATVLSVASFLRTLPYIFLAPIIGYFNTHNILHYFLIIWSLLTCIVVFVYLILKKKQDKVLS